MKSMKNFLKNYYLSSSLYDFIFAYAIYNLLFSLKGLSVSQISILLAWWAFVGLVLEIPTGALADSWSRKKILVLAPIIKALCFVIWFFAQGNFWLYGLGFLFWSLGSSLISGTTESLLYDYSVYSNRKYEYEKLLGKKEFFFHIALAIAIISGGILASYNLDLTLLLSIVPLILSSIFASFLKDIPKAQTTGETHYLEYIKTAIREIKSNKFLPYLMIYLLAISILGNLEEFDQLYYKLADLPIISFGIIGFIWSVLNAIGAKYAYKLKEYNNIFYILPLISGICLLFVARSASIFSIGLLLLSYFIATPIRVLIEAKVQNAISSNSRATITSATSLFINAFGVMITIIFGLISKLGLQAIYLVTGIFIICFAVYAFLTKKKLIMN